MVNDYQWWLIFFDCPSRLGLTTNAKLTVGHSQEHEVYGHKVWPINFKSGS